MDKEIDEILDKIEEGIEMGEGVSLDYYLRDAGYSRAKAKQAIKALITAARYDVYWQILHYVEPNSELQAVILRLLKESTLTNDKIEGEHGDSK